MRMMKYIQAINNFTIDFLKFIGKGLYSNNQKTKTFSVMILAFVIMLILEVMNKSVKIISLKEQDDTLMLLMQKNFNFIGLFFVAIAVINIFRYIKTINKKNDNVIRYVTKVSMDYDTLYENINTGIKMYGLCFPYKDEEGVILDKSVPVNLQKIQGSKWVECGTIGVQYFSVETKEEFIEKCKKYNIKYFPLSEI